MNQNIYIEIFVLRMNVLRSREEILNLQTPIQMLNIFGSITICTAYFGHPHRSPVSSVRVAVSIESSQPKYKLEMSDLSEMHVKQIGWHQT